MRKEYVQPLDLKNAEARAQWTRRYFGGQFCADHRSEQERERFERWYSEALTKAQPFLYGGRRHAS